MGWSTGEKPMVMDPRIGGSSPGKSMGNSSSKALRERIRHLTTEPTGEFVYCHAFWPALPTCLFPFLPPEINLSHQGNGTFWVFHGTAGTSPYPSSSGMIPDKGHRWLCQQTWDMYWCLLISESQAWSIAPWSIIFTKVTRTRCQKWSPSSTNRGFFLPKLREKTTRLSRPQNWLVQPPIFCTTASSCILMKSRWRSANCSVSSGI